MTASQPSHREHLLLYEPRTEGHHLVWLRFVTDDLLSAGWQLTLAIDGRPESMERVRKRLGPVLVKVTVMSVWDQSGKRIGGGGVNEVAECFQQSKAERVFLNTFDEIASPLLRKAALGLMPPKALHGRMSGIYIRPRFLAERRFSLNERMKDSGFSRLMNGGWFSHLLFIDPWIRDVCAARFPKTPAYFLPDPSPDDFAGDQASAQNHFEIPAGRKVLLFYGGAYRRKGLHLAIEALLGLPHDSPAFLLCAGQQMDDPEIRRGLETLVAQGRAKVISRYIFEEEDKLLFAASDVVLLPYIKHFGNSAVLSRAGGAGKMVIASDEELVGRLVRKHDLGLLFPSGDAIAFRETIKRACEATSGELAQWQAAAFRYAQFSSRAEVRRVLQQSFTQAFERSPAIKEPSR
jgi:glycosyltransferase involved in cell wall biosynthesis